MEWWVDFSEIIRNIGLVVAAAVGVLLAWGRVRAANQQAEASIRQAELGRREHVAALFNQAVGQLASDKLEVRLGAIYTLRQIGEDFPDLTGAVFELLTTYIRNSSKDYGNEAPPADVAEIFEILRKRLESRK